MGALRFQGKVRDFRAALRRLEGINLGTVLTDEIGRRRYQRELRRAEMRSLRRRILCSGGDGPHAA